MDLSLDAPVVVFTGGNGAGKTTLIEGIYLLSRGRSFRGRKFGSLTTDGEQGTVVRAMIRDVDGVNRNREFRLIGGGVDRRVDGVSLQESAAPRFEVRLVGESAHSLVDGEPAMRRRFLDWNLFHVEPAFEWCWERFRRIQRQRNAWLSAGGHGRAAWDEAYVDASLSLTALRERYLRELSAELVRLTSDSHLLQGLGLKLYPGWPDGASLADFLLLERSKDVSSGYSRRGPARADIQIGLDGRPARLSRGQCKVAVVLMQLAARALGFKKAGVKPIWLVDDLRADLDPDSIRSLVLLLKRSGDQCVFTGIGDKSLMDLSGSDMASFHVEQGTVRKS